MSAVRIQQLYELLKQEPDDAFLQHALAMEFLSLHEYEKAKESFSTLLAKQPDYLPSYYQLGHTLKLLDKKTEAVQIYIKGLEMAIRQQNKKAQAELQEAIWQLED